MIAHMGEWQIRSLADADVDSIAIYANNRNVSINLTDAFPYPYTMADAQKWVRHVRRGKSELNYAIVTGNEAIGCVGFRLFGDVRRLTAEIGYWIGEPFWGRGIATAVAKRMTRYAFDNFDIVRLQASVFESNPASARVLEKAGFILEGRMREAVIKENTILDMLMYAIVRSG